MPRRERAVNGVKRIADPHHPRGYREKRSPAAMRDLVNRKIIAQNGRCGICGLEFEDRRDVVPDHIDRKGMGGARRDDHPDNIQAVHSACNAEKGSQSMEQVRELDMRAEIVRLRESFQGNKCPACGKLKRDGVTFCADCYHRLPPQMQQDLYRLDRITSYVQAVNDAKQFLSRGPQERKEGA